MRYSINSLLCFLTVAVFMFGSFGCKKGFEARYGPFYIMSDTTVYFEGDMGSRIDKQFERMLCDYPSIQSITFSDYCPGSRNDEKLYIAARNLRSHEISTILTNQSIIESGAVDLFIAGYNRQTAPGAKIGVHCWSMGSQDADDFPIGHEEHEMYLDFYGEMFEDADLGEEFYWFTTKSASSNNIHYMTDEEINYFQLETE